MRTRSLLCGLAMAVVGLFAWAVVGGRADAAVRERLALALAASEDLRGKAEAPDARTLDQVRPQSTVRDEAEYPVGRALPRRSHVEQYTQHRPWCWAYPHVFWARHAVPEVTWPTASDAPALRSLLRDEDPAIRSLAVEALATLHQPEDVPAIAGLLLDDAAGAPVLGFSMQMSATAFLDGKDPDRDDADPLVVLRKWHPRQVKTYAREALDLMTHQSFVDKASFDEWWKTHSNARECLWYWQRRLLLAMERIHHAHHPDRDPQRTGETWDAYRVRVDQAVSDEQAEARRVVAKELAGLSPEVDAKVRLLARFERGSGGGIPDPFFPDPPELRISRQRTFELMDGTNLWQDVDWRSKHGFMVRRLALSAESLFGPEDAAAMRQRRDAHRGDGLRAPLTIGLSRLLPAAQTDRLDDPQTRDGVLREAILQHNETFARGELATELARIGLPANRGFLIDVFFAETDPKSLPDIRGSILQELGRRPLTEAKREALAEILLDERFVPRWTAPSLHMGDDMHRRYAMWAVNAHLGRDALTHMRDQELRDPRTSQRALPEVLEVVKTLRRPATRPAGASRSL